MTVSLAKILRVSCVGILAPLLGAVSHAAEVRAKENLQRGIILSSSDIEIKLSKDESELSVLNQYVGRELKRNIYANVIIRPSDIREPVLIKRNAMINMIYKFGALELTAEGRALAEGGKGERISVMNMSSRKRIDGVIIDASTVEMSR